MRYFLSLVEWSMHADCLRLHGGSSSSRSTIVSGLGYILKPSFVGGYIQIKLILVLYAINQTTPVMWHKNQSAPWSDCEWKADQSFSSLTPTSLSIPLSLALPVSPHSLSLYPSPSLSLNYLLPSRGEHDYHHSGCVACLHHRVPRSGV